MKESSLKSNACYLFRATVWGSPQGTLVRAGVPCVFIIAPVMLLRQEALFRKNFIERGQDLLLPSFCLSYRIRILLVLELEYSSRKCRVFFAPIETLSTLVTEKRAISWDSGLTSRAQVKHDGALTYNTVLNQPFSSIGFSGRRENPALCYIYADNLFLSFTNKHSLVLHLSI